MKYIKRLIEDILNDRFENSKCVLVSGTRQVGKSTLLKHLYSNINYVTFDDLLFKNLANDVKENEIDLIIEENGILYPIEIKKSANPTLSMAKAFKVLDKEIEKKRGKGAIVCLYDKKVLLREDVVVLPIEYI